MLINSDALHIPLADKSVHCCITSPPYFGLRNYDLGDAGIGLEPTMEEYIYNMVRVFREVWRVLRDDGTAWVNLGDSYNANTGSGFNGQKRYDHANRNTKMRLALRPKNLVGIPWRVAFALQADGWYLRSDVIWHKPNPMPESVTDRPTKSHEYVFLLTKRARYFYDGDAIRESSPDYAIERIARESSKGMNGPVKSKIGDHVGLSQSSMMRRQQGGRRPGRNRRTVWTIATAPYSGAHFATFPPKLIEPMVKAGTSEHGVCPECGAPWKRVTEKTTRFEGGSGKAGRTAADVNVSGKWAGKQYGENIKLGPVVSVNTLYWKPTCSHSRDPVPATILDPFVGSGTTVQVARSLGRRGIGIDLSPEYLQLARQRLELDKLDDWGKGINDTAVYDNLPLFRGEG